MRFPLLATACLSGLLLAGAAAPQEGEPAAADSGILSIQLLERGDRPARPAAGQLVLTAPGDETRLEIRQVRPSDPARTRVVLYFDSAVSSTAALRAAADRYSQRIAELVALGEVEIVLADPQPTAIAPASRDPELIGNALQRIFLRTEAEDVLRQRREIFLRGETLDARAAGDGDGGGGATRGIERLPASQRNELAREAMADELFVLASRHDAMLRWLAEREQSAASGRWTSSYLFLVQESLALDPLSFYSRHADPAELAALATEAPSAVLLAEAIAAHGWVLFPLAGASGDDDPALRYAPSEDVPVGFRLRLGRDRDAAEDAGAGGDDSVLLQPAVSSWQAVAAVTGGEAIPGDQLADALARAAQRSELVFAPLDPLLGELSLSLTDAGERRTLRAPRRAPVGHHPLVAAARLREMAEGGDLAAADYRLEAEFVLDPTARTLRTGLLRALLRPDDQAGDDEAEDDETGAGETVTGTADETADEIADVGDPWRLSLRFRDLDGVGTLRQWTIEPEGESEDEDEDAQADGEADSGSGSESGSEVSAARIRAAGADPGAWALEAPIELPVGTTGVTALVENLRTGAWGAGEAEIVNRVPEGGDVGGAGEEITQARPLRLLPPPAGSLSGRVTFEVETTPEVERVVYYLGNKRVARRGRPPFDVTLNLGSSPRTLQLVAAAFDRDGAELGRDRLLLNEPPETFWVRIVSPEPGADVAGATEVEARLRTPRDASLDSLTFYWKERRIESLREPPFTATVDLPVGEPDGFLRVEARLSDGRTAEDVLLVNQGGFGEQIGVELVELYVVATDRSSKPVLGLDEDVFEVYEDGRRQEIESFEAAGNLPLTIGLAIDSSSSLFLRMPEVQQAATRFVRSLSTRRDRAFLIGFGTEPRIVARTTRDLRRIEDAVRGLEPYGTTAVWGAIDMALQQLDGIDGRKALVVFYDGDDEDEERYFERSLRLARRANVPIYLVLMNDMAARTAGRSLSSRSFVGKLERITRAGGGRVFYVRKDQELDPIFDAISEELRSHYLLTYYPEIRPGGPLWRPVEVRIQQRGVEARTIEGRGVEGY
ncbi:MAG: VWA domain-containing protein [Acidobacteria bacterium]|nr:MAG: VWA domain-containing protein [Acidobacteriota bacterium]REK10522.1 MAG: VWA domain-containing protein [Acidobacteriota bacterium]